MKRYTVTVKENGDQYRAFSMKRIYRWMFEYEHHTLNQDIPWEPHFEITTETLKGEREYAEN